MNEKNLALFIREIIIIFYKDKIYMDKILINNLNDFISQYYKDNQPLFQLLFTNTKLLESFIDNNYEVLPGEVIYYLSHKYGQTEDYVKLLDSVDPETQKEIDTLIEMFIRYHNEIIESYKRQKNNKIRILQ